MFNDDVAGKQWTVSGVLRLGWLVGWLLLGLASSVNAEEIQLQDLQFKTLPGDKLQLIFKFDGPAVAPKIFQTNNPARIVLDFAGVKNSLAKKHIPINMGVVTHVSVVNGGGRLRAVINQVEQTPYEFKLQGDTLLLTVENASMAAASAASSQVAEKDLLGQRIEKIDFRRGPNGEGRILIHLANPNTLVDLREEGGRVIATFLNTTLPRNLAKKLDVTDFATPVKSVTAFSDGKKTRLVVTPVSTAYDYLSYQSDRLLTIEFRPLTRAEKEKIKKKKFPYTGQKLSLNFQDIPVRSVLQILADFTGLNIIAADSVKGNVTLRLNNVPWDQALDLILKAKGLGKRKEGNVVWIAPLDEIIKLEKKELEHVQFKEQKEPLRTEIIQLNYATAADIQRVLKGMQRTAAREDTGTVPEYATTFDDGRSSAADGAVGGGSILSPRGEVNIDQRTNILIVKDTPTNLQAIRKLVHRLDRPVRQVLIESRVVIADDNFARELGVKLAARRDTGSPGNTQTSLGGALDAVGSIVDLPAAVGSGAGGAFGIAIFKLNDYLMRLEISALQAENRGEVISMPKVVTQDQTQASIEQGVEIPFQTVSQNGTQTQFKEAVLKLDVTPHITPDDKVVMDLLVKKDAPGEKTPQGAIAINKREIRTTVQVANGETVVLGGVYEHEKRKNVDKVPFFGSIPGFGFFFRKVGNIDKKNELLIFITPKILKQAIQM